MKQSKLFTALLCSAAVMILMTVILIAAASRMETDAPSQGEQLTSIQIIGDIDVGDGTWQPLTNDVTFLSDTYHKVTVRGHFSQDIPENVELLFHIRSLFIALKINGEEVFNFHTEGNEGRFIHSRGMTWVSYLSTGISTEDEVELIMYNAYIRMPPSYRELLNHMLMGSRSLLFERMVSENASILFVSLFIIFLAIISIGLALVAKISHLAQASKAAALAFFAIVSGGWMLVDSNFLYMPLLIPHPMVASMTDILTMYLMSPATVLLILAYISDHLKRPVRIAAIALCSQVAVMIGLQALGAIQLYEMQTTIIIPGIIVTFFTIFCSLWDCFKNKNKESLLMLLTLVPFTSAAVMEAVNYYVPFMISRTAYPTGCLITLVLQIVQIVYMIQRSGREAIRASKLEQELAEKRIDIMLSQIQPHFLYNTLATIEALCNKDNSKTAAKMVRDFSSYLRENMDSLTQKKLVSFNRELEHIKIYLDIEKQRLMEKLTVAYDLEVTDFELPTLVVQPLVENAVRYGISKKRYGGRVTISTELVPEGVKIMVSDDGAGFASVTLDPIAPAGAGRMDERSHIGIANVRERLHSQCGGTLEVESAIGEGTVCTVIVPQKNIF